MNANELNRSLVTLFNELVNGVPTRPAYILNGGDVGLLASLDKLSAEHASHASQGGATIAAHTAHLLYGLTLMNRWAAGENPWKDADWSLAWKLPAPNDKQWTVLRRSLRDEVERWLESQRTLREVTGSELDSVIGTVVHLAYHMGAIRQIDREARCPPETG